MSEDEMTVESDTTCPVCQAEFLDAADLVIHLSQVHAINAPEGPAQQISEHALKPTLQQCLFCYDIFASMEELALHLRDVHITSMKCCKFCTKAFIHLDLLKSHENKHTIKKSAYNCSQCKHQFQTMFLLEQHELEFHNNAEDGILLNNCLSILSSVLNMKAPKFLQSLHTTSFFVCGQCEMSTSDIHDYLNHLWTRNCRSFVCDKCCNIYRTKKALTRHITMHKPCQHYLKHCDLVKACKNCGVEFDNLKLAGHMKYCKPIQCNICKTTWQTVTELSNHRVTAHPMAIVMQHCRFCKKECVGTVALDRHIERVHKTDMHLYKYKCINCEDVVYKHPRKLFVHYSSKHPNLEPYCCKICNKLFKIRKRFTLHIKLDHKSVGFVEFDENYHVFFTDKKSKKPFLPKSLFIDEHNEDKNGSKVLNLKEEIVTDAATDAPTDMPTDLPTDSETDNDKAIPPKLRFKRNKTKNDIKKSSKKMTKKLKSSYFRAKNLELLQKSDDDSEDEPLLKIKQRENLRQLSKQNMFKKRKNTKNSKMRFTCNICSKYCYTFNNYNHHISLHFKEESKKCIKCSKEFRTTSELKTHISKEHKSSQLTETLKSLLERRKKGVNNVIELTTTEKFQRTIKRVKYTPTPTAAKITEVKEKSVKSFIETFTPEIENSLKPIQVIANNITMKTLNTPIYKPSTIKMTKFTPKPLESNGKLAMPVKFKEGPMQNIKVNIKLIQTPTTFENETSDHFEVTEEPFFDFEEEINKDGVPEMAEEVMLEGTEEIMNVRSPVVTADTPCQIAISNSSTTKYQDIRIAHMLPQAPFYKIVKVKDLIEKHEKKSPALPEVKKEIKLPSGTKLVTVNPLAHLLGDKSIDHFLPSKKRYYKTKIDSNNMEIALRKALMNLDQPQVSKKAKKSVDVEQ